MQRGSDHSARYPASFEEADLQVFIYIDDLLVASDTFEEHSEHLRLVFECLSEHLFSVNEGKCVLGQTAADFTGYKITPDGSDPLPVRVQAIIDYKIGDH